MAITAIDLFAGLGGFSEGARRAGFNVVWAANHWALACEYYALNHCILPQCQDLQQADWSKVPGHDVLLASPACQGHSKARGSDKPHHDIQRSTAWAVVSAAEYHRPKAIVVENVLEFLQWTLFSAWQQALTKLGYVVSSHVLDAADSGVPQNRVRAIVICTRSSKPIKLHLPRRKHVPACSILNFSDGRWSRINKPTRSPATLERIKNGRSVYGERFIFSYYGNTKTGRCMRRPIGTITTRDRWAVVDGDKMRMLTVDEARKAMGFGEAYKLPSNSREAMHLLGNAVCPPKAADILTALKEQI